MLFEIAICTWDRSSSLARTLDALTRLSVPPQDSWRVLVIDNNSHDETPAVIDTFRDRLPLVAQREPEQGHSAARNRAVAEARGDWLLWTDDDVIPDPDWLVQYRAAISEFPDCSFFGGPITVKFDPPAPQWIHEQWDKLRGCYAERQLGNESVGFTPHRLPYGANWCVRTELQKSLTYCPSTGRRGSEVTGHDELAVMRQMLERGLRGRWVPRASVQHVIDARRQTSNYVARYFEGQGRRLVIEGRAWTDDIRQLRRTARWELACARVKRPWASSEEWVSHLIHGSLARGQWLALATRPK